MSVPIRKTGKSMTWVMGRSLEKVPLPKWLKEAAILLSEANDGDTIYVQTRLDMVQLESGAEHVGKKLNIIVGSYRMRLAGAKMIKVGLFGHEIVDAEYS